MRTEQIMRERNGAGRNWCLVRPTTVWGPGMSPHYRKMLNLIDWGLYFHVNRGALNKSYSYIEKIAHQYTILAAVKNLMIHRKILYLADYDPLSLRRYVDDIAKTIGAKPIPAFPLALPQTFAWCVDLGSGLFRRPLPFNSFRLQNILIEYVHDLRSTAEICGCQPGSYPDAIRRTALWYLEGKKVLLDERSNRQG